MKAYNDLSNIFKEIGLFQSICSLIQWDNSTVMPKGGAKNRQEQLVLLSGKINQVVNDPKIADLIEHSGTENLNDWQKANLKRIKNSYLHNKAVNQSLAEELIKAALECEFNWREARKNNDFKLFSKYFKPLLKLIKEESTRKAEILNLAEYDSLLDLYDMGRKSEEIDIIFADLEKFLPDFIKSVKEKQKNEKASPFANPIEKQKDIGLICMKALGFDLNRGRLDESTHPFSTNFAINDVRITTRYEKEDGLSSLAAVLHEAGHGIYEQNRPIEFEYQPVGEACGMSIHESQSLFVERHIGITREFFDWLSLHIPNFDIENAYKFSTKVGVSSIRVNADEVTYPAHIIIRYKIEKALLSGELDVEDIPQVWDEESIKFFGNKPKNFQEGCLQDIHWAWGNIGYFPTYTLGAMFAAQINEYLGKLIPISDLIREGNFKPIIEWLNKNIHAYGSKYTSNELILKSTGSTLDPKIFKNYLINKYLECK